MLGPAGETDRAAGRLGNARVRPSSATVTAAVLLIALPVAFNVAFALLAARFDYPDILRRPTAEILERFRKGGSGLVLLWWGFALTAVLLALLAVLLAAALDGADPALLGTGVTVGVLAAVVQFLGLIRWPFLVPYLARADAEPGATLPAGRRSTSSFNPSTDIWASRSASTSASSSPGPGASWPARP